MGIVAKHVVKNFGSPEVRVLKDITFTIETGEFVALTGRSGSGKSTLLYILSSLDFATKGSVEIDGRDLSGLGSEALHRLRNEKIGFVFQQNYLINELTLLENVMMPTLKFDQYDQFYENALTLIRRFDLAEKLDRFPRELSGGEQQRVSIARALVMKPKYLFADEPTGSLDTANGAVVMQIIKDVNREGTTVVMVTHDVGFSNEAQRKINLSDGQLA